MSIEYTGYGIPEPRADVHYCTPDSGHPLHRTIGMGRTPGWYVLTMHGCLGNVSGPFDTEPEAQAVADSWLAKTQADRKARGL